MKIFSLSVVRFLVHQEAKLNADSKVCSYIYVQYCSFTKRFLQEGKTVLHYATIAGHIDIVDYLVEKGADLNFAARVCLFNYIHKLNVMYTFIVG